MSYYLIDANGRSFRTVQDSLVDNPHPITDFYGTDAVNHTQTPPPATMVDPVYNGTVWVENSDAPTIAADLVAYKSRHRARVDLEAKSRYDELMGLTNDYKVRVHNAKLWEANEQYNVDNTATEAPANERTDAAFSPNPRPILKAEADAKGVAIGTLATQVRDRNGNAWTLMADIEAIRPKAHDDIEAATDRAGVDTVYAAWQTAIAAVTVP
jgi:hypothetical protein